MQQSPPSDFARVRRAPKRGAYDLATIHAILDAGMVCHIGHIIDGRAVALPTFYWRRGEHVYWHGSTTSRLVQSCAAGGEVCLTVTLLDGWVLARSAFHHSANYRSVACFGRPTLIEEREAKLAAMKDFVDRLFPGRWEKLRPPLEKEIKATAILSLPLTEASAKLRTGGPIDDEEDLDWPVWAGVLPLHISADPPIVADGVPPGQEPPTAPL